ncbi:MAG: carboxypeptidase M32 [Thermotogae bacterium]|nr:carboxypeptidase M32 [Thermotogota bacterium]
MTPKEAYDTLISEVVKVSLLLSVRGLLTWDQRTYMPKKAARFRGMQYSVLAEYAHDFITSDRFRSLLERAEEGDWERNSREGMNLFWLRREYDHQMKLPKELQLRIVKLATEMEVLWREAKRDDDPSKVLPLLKEMVSLKREVAERLGYENEPYDALLDGYEPGLKATEVEEVFSYIKTETVKLLRKVMEARERGKVPNRELFAGRYPVARQREFNLFLLREIGYDLDAGRLDETTHPFAVRITPNDVRITTRYKEEDLPDGIFSTLHEMGHALYGMGLPEEWFGEPVGNAASLSVHESQSRFWENVVGRSPEFWERFYPYLRAFFPNLYGAPMEEFVFLINDIRPSFIRIEADELTYNLHIILRFELERAMINGQLDVSDLPEAWNEKFKEMFGMEPPSHREGFLQDIHWYSGSFGYFPTYTLGNVMAAQIRAKMSDEIDLQRAVREGEFARILGWLRSKIHRHGALYLSKDLINLATGEPPKAKYLMDYLARKVERFYG